MPSDANWSRRNLLTARGLGASAGGLLGTLFEDNNSSSTIADQSIAHWCLARRAMACEFSVYLPPILANPLDAGQAALDEIDRMEDLLSIYRPTSSLCYVNSYAADGPVRVDNRLFQILTRSAELYEQTAGAFDVSAHALVKAWGFFTGRKRVPSESDRLTALARTGMHNVELDAHKLTVYYRVRGLEINLGSIGKGFAIDRAVKRLREEYEVDCGLIQGGLSSIYGFGVPAGEQGGWLVGIHNPFDPSRRVATVRLRNRALATSNSANQYFERNGRRYGHILDPRTGMPADELGSVSVFADDAATADALATGLLVMGLDKAADFCKNHPGIAALCVLRPERSGPEACGQPSVLTFNLPKGDVNLSPGENPPVARKLDIPNKTILL